MSRVERSHSIEEWLHIADVSTSACQGKCASLPFGDGLNCNGNTDPGGLHFTGKKHDIESGLDYFNARYYDENVGRFTSPDPLGGHLEDPQTLNKYSYVRNNPLSLSDPTGLDFHLMGCGQTNTLNCQNNISGTYDSMGVFSPTVITRSSLSDPNSGNTAVVNGNGVMITTGTGTSNQQTEEGIFIANTPAADIQGQGAGWDQFTYHIDSSDVSRGILDSGEANYNGSGGYQGMVDTIKSMTADGHGPFHYPEEALGNPFHPGATNYRFSTGAHPDLFNYGPSPHFPVPTSGTSVPDFHIDRETGPIHGPCALMGVGCY